MLSVSGKSGTVNEHTNRYHRPLSRRIPPPAGSVPRRRRRKKFGAPPDQPKFMDAAAAVFFSARRSASEQKQNASVDKACIEFSCGLAANVFRTVPA